MMRHKILPLVLAAGTALVPTPGQANDALPPAMAHLPLVAMLAQAGAGEFGAVIDSRRPGVAGRTVLAVTPGGVAERMGVRRGDVLVSVDGTRLDAAGNASSTLRSAMASAHGALTVEIQRDGRPLTLSSTHERSPTDGVAAIAGCGYLSSEGAPPRNTQGIYPVEIVNIDGASTPAMFQPNRHRVDAGRHVLIVRERVDDHRFTPLPLKERQRLLERDRARAYKVLIVDVDTDIRYDIGARLTNPHPDLSSIRDNSYWEPVVWKRTPDACPATPKRAAAAIVPLPAAGCTYVTAHGRPADGTLRVFPIAITAIDGLENFRPGTDMGSTSSARTGFAPTGGSRYHRLSPGAHAFTLRARIDQVDLPRADQRLIAHHQNSAIAARADHTLTLHADPSRGYWIGGRLRDVPINAETIRDGSWWEPVVVEKPGDLICPW